MSNNRDFTWKGKPFAALSHPELLEVARTLAMVVHKLGIDTLIVGEGKSALAEAVAPGAGKMVNPEAAAKMRGYTGDSCPECQNLTMVRNGTCLRCDTCGSTTGCS